MVSLFTSVINKCVTFSMLEKKETNIHLEQLFYSLTKTWKYDGSVFGREIVGGAEAE